MSEKSKTCFGKASGKPLTSYSSEQEANEAMKYRNKLQPNKKLYAYKCDKCGHWHLALKSRQTPSVTCSCTDSTGKKKQLYATKKDAQTRAKILKKEQGVKLKVYKCPISNGYHLTHKL